VQASGLAETEEGHDEFALRRKEMHALSRDLLLLTVLGMFFGQPVDAATPPLPTPVLISPTNGEEGVATGPMLDWGNVATATEYRIFVHESKSVLQSIPASQKTCSGCRVNAVTTSSMFRFSYSDPLEPRRQYYWMVRAGNSSAGSPNSQIWTFRTGEQPVQVLYNSGGPLGSDYYIVKVRLDSGARVEPYLGTRLVSGSGITCLGQGYNYFQFKASNVAGFIGGSSEIAGARAVISGSFHDDNGRPAFPQKLRTKIETYGADCVTSSIYSGKLRMLEIRNPEGRAFVEPFDLSKFKSTAIAPNVIIGLHPDFPKHESLPTIGRNFACVRDPNGGGYKTVLFLVTDGMTSSMAKGILVTQGCEANLMIQIDGSTVAQLSEKVGSTWQHRITDKRQMPQVFAIFNPK
jgi:hypothetical protein